MCFEIIEKNEAKKILKRKRKVKESKDIERKLKIVAEVVKKENETEQKLNAEI